MREKRKKRSNKRVNRSHSVRHSASLRHTFPLLVTRIGYSCKNNGHCQSGHCSIALRVSNPERRRIVLTIEVAPMESQGEKQSTGPVSKEHYAVLSQGKDQGGIIVARGRPSEETAAPHRNVNSVTPFADVLRRRSRPSPAPARPRPWGLRHGVYRPRIPTARFCAG